MKVVKVYGPLRKYLGQCRFEFVADTPAQAMKALCVNFPGLAQWLLDREAEGMAFRVTRGRDKITNEAPEGLVLPWSEREVFSIAPVIVGAGRGVGQILAGIALVALAIVAGPAAGGFLGLGAGLGGATGAGAAVSLGLVGGGFASAVGFLGVSLIIGGVAQLISPTPSMGSLTSGREAARLESFTFSGIVNTSKQGMAVPICYGRAFVGSAVISSGLDVDQVAV
jgi:predicted phage tail protein